MYRKVSNFPVAAVLLTVYAVYFLISGLINVFQLIGFSVGASSVITQLLLDSLVLTLYLLLIISLYMRKCGAFPAVVSLLLGLYYCAASVLPFIAMLFSGPMRGGYGLSLSLLSLGIRFLTAFVWLSLFSVILLCRFSSPEKRHKKPWYIPGCLSLLCALASFGGNMLLMSRYQNAITLRYFLPQLLRALPSVLMIVSMFFAGWWYAHPYRKKLVPLSPVYDPPLEDKKELTQAESCAIIQETDEAEQVSPSSVPPESCGQ